jgi:AhpD family alkylhydroperoxidase
MSTAPFVPIRVSERPPPVPRQARQLIGQSHERILALSPRLDLIAHAQAQYAALATFDNSITLDTRLRELVTLHASQINGCAFCIDMHWRAARTAGESEERLYLLGAWREADYYSDRERAALELCEAITVVTQGHVPADVWERAAAVFDRDELAQLVMAVAAINAWNRIATALRTPPGQNRGNDEAPPNTTSSAHP